MVVFLLCPGIYIVTRQFLMTHIPEPWFEIVCGWIDPLLFLECMLHPTLQLLGVEDGHTIAYAKRRSWWVGTFICLAALRGMVWVVLQGILETPVPGELQVVYRAVQMATVATLFLYYVHGHSLTSATDSRFNSSSMLLILYVMSPLAAAVYAVPVTNVELHAVLYALLTVTLGCVMVFNYRAVAKRQFMWMDGVVSYGMTLWCLPVGSALFLQTTAPVLVLYGLMLVIAQLLYFAAHHSAAAACSPHLRRTFLFPHLAWLYLCQFALFGFTRLSWQLVILNLMTMLHQLLRYGHVYRWLLTWCSRSQPRGAVEMILFALGESRLRKQETLCILQSFISLHLLVYWFRYQNINAAFTSRFVDDGLELVGIIAVQVAFQAITWLLIHWIISIRLKYELTELNWTSGCLFGAGRVRPMRELLLQYVEGSLALPGATDSHKYVVQHVQSDHPGLVAEQVSCDANQTTERLLGDAGWWTLLAREYGYFCVSSCCMYTLLMTPLIMG